MSRRDLYPEDNVGRVVAERRARQRREALARGNERRMAVAKLKRDIRAEKVDPIRVLDGWEEDYEEGLSHTKIKDFLKAIPKVGETTANAVLKEMNVGGHIRFRDMTPEQREELASIVRLLKWKVI